MLEWSVCARNSFFIISCSFEGVSRDVSNYCRRLSTVKSFVKHLFNWTRIWSSNCIPFRKYDLVHLSHADALRTAGPEAVACRPAPRQDWSGRGTQTDRTASCVFIMLYRVLHKRLAVGTKHGVAVLRILVAPSLNHFYHVPSSFSLFPLSFFLYFIFHLPVLRFSVCMFLFMNSNDCNSSISFHSVLELLTV